ncbi:MAG: hypothetical protein P857_757 [Candidatus Xenolissoclinum pacificiensis L6]|uniref:Uncharacterized protein n=1 Tax=Candidatus Xenolissoclinum pacificiensis L6 TaxID=1401685 RepID=W2V1F9_9RICK|nr:MAG: hypothetical protein P857_757 [Candidatus Xenolissoclinum pacificiensis L6]
MASFSYQEFLSGYWDKNREFIGSILKTNNPFVKVFSEIFSFISLLPSVLYVIGKASWMYVITTISPNTEVDFSKSSDGHTQGKTHAEEHDEHLTLDKAGRDGNLFHSASLSEQNRQVGFKDRDPSSSSRVSSIHGSASQVDENKVRLLQEERESTGKRNKNVWRFNAFAQNVSIGRGKTSGSILQEKNLFQDKNVQHIIVLDAGHIFQNSQRLNTKDGVRCYSNSLEEQLLKYLQEKFNHNNPITVGQYLSSNPESSVKMLQKDKFFDNSHVFDDFHGANGGLKHVLIGRVAKEDETLKYDKGLKFLSDDIKVRGVMEAYLNSVYEAYSRVLGDVIDSLNNQKDQQRMVVCIPMLGTGGMHLRDLTPATVIGTRNGVEISFADVYTQTICRALAKCFAEAPDKVVEMVEVGRLQLKFKDYDNEWSQNFSNVLQDQYLQYVQNVPVRDAILKSDTPIEEKFLPSSHVTVSREVQSGMITSTLSISPQEDDVQIGSTKLQGRNVDILSYGMRNPNPFFMEKNEQGKRIINIIVDAAGVAFDGSSELNGLSGVSARIVSTLRSAMRSKNLSENQIKDIYYPVDDDGNGIIRMKAGDVHVDYHFFGRMYIRNRFVEKDNILIFAMSVNMQSLGHKSISNPTQYRNFHGKRIDLAYYNKLSQFRDFLENVMKEVYRARSVRLANIQDLDSVEMIIRVPLFSTGVYGLQDTNLVMGVDEAGKAYKYGQWYYDTMVSVVANSRMEEWVKSKTSEEKKRVLEQKIIFFDYEGKILIGEGKNFERDVENTLQDLLKDRKQQSDMIIPVLETVGGVFM